MLHRKNQRMEPALEIRPRRREACVLPAGESLPEAVAGAEVGCVAGEGGERGGEDVFCAGDGQGSCDHVVV